MIFLLDTSVFVTQGLWGDVKVADLDEAKSVNLLTRSGSD